MLFQSEPKAYLDSRELGATSRLIVVSNRGGIEHYLDEFGRLKRRKASGGVAVALNTVAQEEPVTWIAAAAGFADRVVAIAGGEVDLGSGSFLKLVNVPDEVYEAHYRVFCNPLLWFVQHEIADCLDEDRDVAAQAIEAWRDGYVPANRLFADAVIDEIDRAGGARVMLHDYHLYLAPRFIRAARPDVTLQQFVHIPWPEPRAWQVLPDGIVREILAGLLANDSITFQTDEAVVNFLACCRAYLGSRAQVWERRGEVEFQGHTATAWANPISVDVEELEDAVRSEEFQAAKAEFDGISEQLIVRVDRLDPSKNVLRGFQAYERLLEANPKLQGKVRFLACLVPSRESIPEYADYARRTLDLVESINARFGRPDWTPITVLHQHNRAHALAAMARADVLLVNSVADGMNLVSKEGPILNDRYGVVVLSRTAGSYEQLRPGVLGIDPFDIQDTARALEEALLLSEETREEMAVMLKTAIRSHQLPDWLRLQTKDLAIHEYVKGLAAASGRG